MRSEYSWIPAGESAGRTEPNQIGISFTNHHAAVFASQGKTREADIAAGSVVVTGSEPITWMRLRESSESLEIFPEARLLAGAEISPAVATRDGTVLAISSLLKRVHTAGHTLTDVAASTLAQLLVEHLIERYTPGRPRSRRRGRLSAATVDRVAQFVDAELSGELTLERLAAVATLSPFHFARAFKATTGQAPHQFVTARRMERAATLLRSSSVIDTAHAVGMSNVSHFRRVFRAHTGLLPGEVSKFRPSL
jgi:AraC family transcriptional regulator